MRARTPLDGRAGALRRFHSFFHSDLRSLIPHSRIPHCIPRIRIDSRNLRTVLGSPKMRSAWWLLVLVLAAGCGDAKELPTDPGGGSGPPDPSATFTRVQNEIFTPNCTFVGCHNRVGTQQDMILEQGFAYGLIVNQASHENPSLSRIKPNDPANSYMYRKVNGTGIVGERMPFGLPPLSDAQIQLLRDWIRRGAPND